MKQHIHSQFQLRRDTFENWQQWNGILSEGEPALIAGSQGVEGIKIGDGQTKFSLLPFIGQEFDLKADQSNVFHILFKDQSGYITNGTVNTKLERIEFRKDG